MTILDALDFVGLVWAVFCALFVVFGLPFMLVAIWRDTDGRGAI